MKLINGGLEDAEKSRTDDPLSLFPRDTDNMNDEAAILRTLVCSKIGTYCPRPVCTHFFLKLPIYDGESPIECL